MLFASAQNRKFRLGSAVCGVLTLLAFSIPIFFATQPAHAQTETVLYTFSCGPFYCSDGGFPESVLTPDGAGNFYGTTSGGGLGDGTVYELSPNGSGGWNYTVLYTFCVIDEDPVLSRYHARDD